MSGGNGHEVFNIASGAMSAAITNLNISSSSTGTGSIDLVENAGSLSITTGSITGSGNLGETRGIYNDSTGKLNLTGVTVTGNTVAQGGTGDPVTAYGGGIYIAGGTVNIIASTVEGNNAVAETCGTLTCGQHSAHGYGGGIYVAAGSVTIFGSTISKNQASADSAYGEDGGDYTSYGAGIDVGGGTVNLFNSIVSGNIGAGDVNGSYSGEGNLVVVRSLWPRWATTAAPRKPCFRCRARRPSAPVCRQIVLSRRTSAASPTPTTPTPAIPRQTCPAWMRARCRPTTPSALPANHPPPAL